jgi:hypothetical protein
VPAVGEDASSRAVAVLSSRAYAQPFVCRLEYQNSQRRWIMKSEKASATQAPRETAVVPSSGNGVGNGAGPGSEVSVDKIRDLLFGNQMQDYDRRFSNLEERVLQRFKDTEAETARNLGAFESNAKKQVDSLAGQFREEKDQRADADKEIERALREQNQALEKRVRAMSDQLSQLDRDMADRLTRESQSLRDEIKQKSADIQLTIERMFAELSNVKTDRTLLASLFVEVAKCLNQDMGSKSMVKSAGAEPARGFAASKLAT